MAIHKPDLPLSGLHSAVTGYVTITRCRRCGIVVGHGDRCQFCIERPADHVDEPGDYIGRHHTEWVTTVDELLIQGDDDEAEFLLWKLIDASEAESLVAQVPPFERHFTRLIQLGRRRGDDRLVKRISERYDKCLALTQQPPEAAAI
jgi:hypothetical protein